jgi:PAS domain S-box-containing protein
VSVRRNPPTTGSKSRLRGLGGPATLARFFELSPDLFCLASPDGRFLHVNESFLRVLGYTREELTSQPYLSFVHDDDRDRTASIAQSLAAGSACVQFENRYRCADGSYRWLQWSAVPWSGKSMMIATARDVTERRRIEDQLVESREQYQDLFENATDLIQSVSVDGRLLFVNRAWREALGYGDDELAAMTFLDILHPSVREHCLSVFGQLLSGGPTQRVETLFQAKDGRLVRVEGSINCRFEGGRPVSTRGIFRDVTERHRAAEETRANQEALKVSETQLRTVVEASIDGVVVIDEHGTIKTFNPAAERLFLYPASEILGRNVRVLMPEPHSSYHYGVRMWLRDGQPAGSVTRGARLRDAARM